MKIIKFVIKMIGMAVIGIAFAIAGAFIGGRVLGSDAIGFGAIGLAIGGILIGYPLGTIVGLILLKKLFHQQGSIWLGTLGAFLGTFIFSVFFIPFLGVVGSLMALIFILAFFSLKNIRA